MSDIPLIERLFQAMNGRYLALRPDDGFTIVAASADFLATTRMDRRIFGRALFDVFPGNPRVGEADGSVTLAESLRRVVDGKRADRLEAQRYDLRLPDAEGGGFEERYWNILNTPVIGADGEIEYIVNHVEEASAKHNRDAIKILESITEGFFTLDRGWRFDYVNREAHRILDQQIGALAGRVLWEVYPGLEGTPFEQGYHRAMYEREKGSFVAFYPNQQRWYEVTTFPSPEGVSVYFRNVSAQKQMEAERERLRDASERQQRIYETALNSTPDFVYVFDLDHRVLYANDALRQTWGVQDARGKHWMELGYPRWHADLHDAELDQVIAARTPVRGEIPFTGTNGTRVYDYIFAPVLDAAGQVVAVAGTTRDVTERQAADQAVRVHAESLAEADRNKDEFLATLSHELRNPLAPLRTAIELLRRGRDVDERSQRLHAMMDRQINSMVRLVEDLLEMSRISRGTLSLRTEQVDLAAVVCNAVETSDALIKAAGHVLVVTGADAPLAVEGDPVRLAQIVSNLLNNAAKYTNDGGRIELSARREAGFAQISVRDNGIGISEALQPRLFKMFSRGDRHSTRHQGGLGIGLALSRRLAEMHGGSLHVHSGGEGLGSEFIVRLPLASAAPAPATAPVPSSALAVSIDVLLVDDNRDAADALTMALDLLGAKVRVAYDGAQALAALRTWTPEMVLLDIGMPGMNGYQVAKAIRGMAGLKQPTVVALTGWGQEEDRQSAREAGFDHHLVKPVDLETLQRLMHSLQR